VRVCVGRLLFDVTVCQERDVLVARQPPEKGKTIESRVRNKRRPERRTLRSHQRLSTSICIGADGW
jgi:hypothetical protein